MIVPLRPLLQFEQLKAHVMRGAGAEVAAPEAEAPPVTDLHAPAPVAQLAGGQNGASEVSRMSPGMSYVLRYHVTVLWNLSIM